MLWHLFFILLIGLILSFLEFIWNSEYIKNLRIKANLKFCVFKSKIAVRCKTSKKITIAFLTYWFFLTWKDGYVFNFIKDETSYLLDVISYLFTNISS